MAGPVRQSRQAPSALNSIDTNENTMTPNPDRCVACGRTSDEVPLLSFDYGGETARICSQHLPVLIHDPTRLAGMLPGAEGLKPADHKD